MQKIISSLLLLLLLLNNACIARQVQKGSSYTESFRGYFVSKRSSEIVFIGEKYHYIFKDESGIISELTKPEWKERIKISQIKLRVDKNNNVYGDVNLEVVEVKDALINSKNNLDLTKLELKNNSSNGNSALVKKTTKIDQASFEKKIFLEKWGFIKDGNNKFNKSSKNISLKGIRYEPALGFNDKIKESFSKEYKAKIFYDENEIKKAALTPIAYAADGLIILAGGIWIPLIIIAITDEKTSEKFINIF